MRKIFLVTAILVAGVFSSHARENLLANESFEQDILSQLSFWQTDSYKNTDEARRVFTVEKPSRSGKRSLAIVNLVPNDTRIVQWVSVEENSYYRITCWVMAENVRGSMVGANISVAGSITPSPDAKDTGNVWKKLELTGKTGPGQTALAVCLRLGFYDNLVTGRAYFEDVFMEKLKTQPAGTVVDFFSNRGTGIIASQTQTAISSWSGPGNIYLYLALGGGFLIILSGILSVAVAGRRRRKRVPSGDKDALSAVAAGTVARMTRAQRKSMRINITVRKPLSGESYRLVELKSINISSTGLLLSSDDLGLFSVGERVAMAATYKRKQYNLGSGRIVRKQETHRGKGAAVRAGFGIVFVDTGEKEKKNITLLLS